MNSRVYKLLPYQVDLSLELPYLRTALNNQASNQARRPEFYKYIEYQNYQCQIKELLFWIS